MTKKRLRYLGKEIHKRHEFVLLPSVRILKWTDYGQNAIYIRWMRFGVIIRFGFVLDKGTYGEERNDDIRYRRQVDDTGMDCIQIPIESTVCIKGLCACLGLKKTECLNVYGIGGSTLIVYDSTIGNEHRFVVGPSLYYALPWFCRTCGEGKLIVDLFEDDCIRISFEPVW
jgi:hypothetical protein